MLGLIIRKLIERWYWTDVFWGGNRDIVLVENLAETNTTKDRKRNKREIGKIFQWLGRGVVRQDERREEEMVEMQRKFEEQQEEGGKKEGESKTEENETEGEEGDETGEVETEEDRIEG
ncbi:hypothetical protein ONS95_008691 [Cadophora gregata]|uniref:uncharacterized protein n=1 Tax=Cadophora gregata TaxID=51156 RepID=UPI0026DB4558|nr:uncharacterized protein ONS95_008691 [Cadophora gregata]KAK0123679.1 hypothetical protein ONS95_008691 [Cadophora gregata]KAK0130025.1 hypothetical protein ONS96_000563 [Cadophora gregata f. sp. sojae]